MYNKQLHVNSMPRKEDMLMNIIQEIYTGNVINSTIQ